MIETKNKLKKLEICLREIAFDDVIYACLECCNQVASDDNYCHHCGQVFVEAV